MATVAAEVIEQLLDPQRAITEMATALKAPGMPVRAFSECASLANPKPGDHVKVVLIQGGANAQTYESRVEMVINKGDLLLVILAWKYYITRSGPVNWPRYYVGWELAKTGTKGAVCNNPPGYELRYA